jgi:hypothetical protein
MSRLNLIAIPAGDAKPYLMAVVDSPEDAERVFNASRRFHKPEPIGYKLEIPEPRRSRKRR